MPTFRRAPLFALPLLLAACASQPTRSTGESAAAQVRATELAFAHSMAQRDHAAFVALLAEDTVFVGSRKVLHGKAEVAAAWASYFEGEKAPFAWEPDSIEVLQSGELALSSGPVTVDGKVISRFNSIWRQELPGVWKIVFDKGSPVCPPAQ